MKEISLTQGQVALVDDEDYEYLNQWKWYAVKYKHTWYAFRSISINKNRRRLAMHRFILKTPDGMETDHIDHNGLNNQKTNIRICTKNENQQNKQPRGKSQFLGVHYYIPIVKRYNKKENKIKTYNYDGKWTASIRMNGHTKNLGYFENETEAALAYDNIAKVYFGEFANLNFPI